MQIHLVAAPNSASLPPVAREARHTITDRLDKFFKMAEHVDARCSAILDTKTLKRRPDSHTLRLR